MAKPFNGHHCWNCWNVSLWIGNDEGLYRMALECKRRPRSDGKPVTAGCATLRFLDMIGPDAKTADGARYTFSGVKRAIADLE